MDGETLRIWDIEASPAKLFQTIAVPALQKASSRVAWTGLRWTGSTLISSYRTARRDGLFHVLTANDSGQLRSNGTTKGFRSNGRDDYESFDTVVSPDGKYIVRAVRSWDDAKFYVVATEFSSGREVSKFPLPQKADFQFDQFATPSSSILGRFSPGSNPDAEQATCLLFSPNSKFLAVSLQEKERKKPLVLLVDARNWKTVTQLSPQNFETSKSKPRRISDLQNPSPGTRFLRCFSPDSKYFVTTEIGDESSTRLSVREAATGGVVRHLEILWPTSSEKAPVLDDAVSFLNDDGETLVGMVGLFDSEWDKRRSQKSLLLRADGGRVNSLDLPVTFAVIPTSDSRNVLYLSPKYQVVTRHGNQIRSWDIIRLINLHSYLRHGDQGWNAGDLPKAFEGYSKFLQDPWIWDLEFFVENEFPQVFSRCVDCYANAGELEKGKRVVVFALDNGFSITPETPQGRQCHQKVLAASEQERRAQQEELDRTAYDRGYQQGHSFGAVMGKRYREAADSPAAQDSIMGGYKSYLKASQNTMLRMVQYEGENSPEARFHTGRYDGVLEGFAEAMRQP